MDETPAALGWRMPAEWEEHAATWIAWPHNRADWPGKFGPIPWVYTEIVRHLHHGEEVRILVNNRRAQTQVQALLKQAHVDVDRVCCHTWPTDRVWTRDYGPIFITSPQGEVGITDWHFNAWAKYDNWQRDDAIPAQVAAALKLRSWQPTVGGRRVVLEGGSIDVNGAGLLLTTEECLLSPIQARNPELSRADIERVLGDYLGVRKVLWLDRGIVGDDTHGHIDDLARFVAPGTVVTVVEDDAADENYRPLQENLERLRGMTDLDGRKLEIVTLPMPAPLYFDGTRIPASYANFYIANERVLVPTFNDPHDRLALGVLAELFPTRKVVGIHAVDLVWGFGTLHCLTQQQPCGHRVERQTGAKLTEALAKLGNATAEDVSKTIAEFHNRDAVDLTKVSIPPSVLEQVPESVARANVVLPLSLDNGVLKLVVSDPDDFGLLEKLRFSLNKEIQAVLAPREQIIDAINRNYGQSATDAVEALE